MVKGETMQSMWKSWCGSLAMCALLALMVGCGSTESEDPAASQSALAGESLRDAVELEERCICPHVVAPVCGEDGNTYGNSCLAACARVEVAYDGECRDEGCNCPAVYDPVCGEDGETYGNACEAGCADVGVAYEGECRDEGCACPRVWDPVCGEDGETYGNACEARCAGVAVAYEGECRDEKPECRTDRDCKVGGCSGQLCGSINDDLISTCEYLPEYACYDQEYTSCGCFGGKCGWEQTEELESCLETAGPGGPVLSEL
ncbi:eight-cysteine-cluster domain-containing protein [Lujinxingia vulgaris]|uniref:Eight-cysteine-cluster domain-containing protein n=2 Tax=Lujinxingia vulgaris TaxID=2600176 RepID=A0A5C6XEQ2_9DELT|nr:eight-cysteine-cluster domain-containing protein [Lujinxingia vulgaris]